MNQKEFENITNKHPYHFMVLVCPAMIPFNFFLHTWIVIKDHDKILRLDLGYLKNKKNPSWGFLYKDLFRPWEGLDPLPGHSGLNYNSRLLYHISGEAGCVAQQMAERTEKNYLNYPYKNHYYLRRHNSNTFVQWVLDQFPKAKFKLPRKAVGR